MICGIEFENTTTMTKPEMKHKFVQSSGKYWWMQFREIYGSFGVFLNQPSFCTGGGRCVGVAHQLWACIIDKLLVNRTTVILAVYNVTSPDKLSQGFQYLDVEGAEKISTTGASWLKRIRWPFCLSPWYLLLYGN